MTQDDARQAVSKAIYEARLEKGWTREDLAKKVRAHVTSVSAWENGSSLPHEKKRILLSELLHIDIVDVSRLAEKTCTCDSKISYIGSHENPHKMVDCLSKIFGASKESMKVIRRNNLNEYKRKQLNPYFDILYNTLKESNINYNVVECIYDMQRLKEIITNIVCMADFNYFIKADPGRPENADMPMLDFFLCDDTHLVISGFSPSLNVHEKPKLILQSEDASSFFQAYWNEVWNRAIPLNYLGGDDLGAIRTFARHFGMSDDDFKATVAAAEEVKATGKINYLL